MSVVVVDQSEDEEIRKMDTKSSSVLIWWLFVAYPALVLSSIWTSRIPTSTSGRTLDYCTLLAPHFG